jgi:hypothetical protein
VARIIAHRAFAHSVNAHLVDGILRGLDSNLIQDPLPDPIPDPIPVSTSDRLGCALLESRKSSLGCCQSSLRRSCKYPPGDPINQSISPVSQSSGQSSTPPARRSLHVEHDHGHYPSIPCTWLRRSANLAIVNNRDPSATCNVTQLLAGYHC